MASFGIIALTAVSFPGAAAPVQCQKRELVVDRRHVLVYAVSDNTVTIVRVWHRSQNRP